MTICFDLNSPFQHNAGDVANFLTCASRYESDPAWFQFKGRPVVVFYGVRNYDVSTQLGDADRASGAVRVPTRPGGECFSQAGEGRGSFCVADDSSAAFDTSFRSLGGVNALGYPASQRFVKDGFLVQVTQGAAMQWRPDQGTSVLANTFEWLSDAGRDDWLLANAGIPLPIRDDGSNGNFQLAKQTRLGWLTDPAITAAFEAAGSTDRAIELYGLPMSAPGRPGPFIVQRFQRIAFRHWVESVAEMPAPGSVVRVLAGDYLKQLGIVPAAAASPPS